MPGIMTKLIAASLPAAFFIAGPGMLRLYKFRTSPGDFYYRLVACESDWIGAHILFFGLAW